MRVRRIALLVPVIGALAGCQTTPQEGPPPKVEAQRQDEVKNQADRVLAADRNDQREERARAERLAASTEPGSGNERFEHDAAAAHRARTFYLQGVRFLSEKPPRVDEAIREFQLSLEADPLFYKAHFKLGYAYYHKGQYELEIAEYLKCLAISSRYLPALINLGHAYLARDQLELARDAYRRALEIQPDHATCQYNLGLIEFDLQNWESSERYLQKFLASKRDETQGPMGDQARKCLDRIRERQGSPN
ncbi:MAG TPA: hypothetical protein DEA08_38735 [Planctomycetes bacterium]|nr:hypothetical protein [Planctomycetota bacterium]